MSLDNQPIKQIKSSSHKICQFSIKRTPLAKIVLIKHSFRGKYTCTDDYFKQLGLLMMPGKLQVTFICLWVQNTISSKLERQLQVLLILVLLT